MATSAPQSYVGQLDPNLNTQLLTAQQQLARARALQGLAMEPIQAPSGQNGRISPLSVLAKALMAYQAPKDIDAASHSLGDVQSKMAQFQMQDQMDWQHHTGRYADQPQQIQPPQPQPQPQDQPPQGQADPQQASQQGQQQPLTSTPQASYPASSPALMARALLGMGPNDPHSGKPHGSPQGQEQAPQQGAQASIMQPRSYQQMLASALQTGSVNPPVAVGLASTDGAAGSSGAPPPASAPGASVPSTNGKGDPAPGMLGTGPTAGGVGTRPPSTSPSIYARLLSQNTGAAGGMPDPMSDPSVRYLMVGARNGYAPEGAVDKAFENYYRMSDNRTDLEKRLLSNNVLPGSPEWRKAHDDTLFKDTYVAPVQVEQGKVVLDAKTNKPFMQTPKMDAGVIADFSLDPMNPSAHAVSGYAQGNAKNVGAARRAEQSNTVFTGVPGDGGSPLSGYGGSLFAGGSGGGGAPAAGSAAVGADPAKGTSSGPQQPPAQGGVPRSSGVVRGQSQTDKLLTDQGGQVYGRITGENTNNASHRQMLNEMSALAQSGQFGPGTGAMARVRALAKNAGIDLGDAQTDQDVMKKLSANMVMSQLGQGGTGTNDQMSSIQSMFPNGEMTNDAMKKVIPMLVSQIDAREARAKVANQFVSGGGQLSQLPGYLSQFNAIADPGTISLGRRMHEASANGTGKQLFNEIQAKYPKTWQGILGRIQQLDQMGAF